jgi:cell division protein ZipA
MGAFQWALLILGVAAVVAVYVYSRRERGKVEPRIEPQATEPKASAPSSRQMDIFSTTSTAGQFDEFGVGKPRRVAPQFGGPAGDEDVQSSEGDLGAPTAERQVPEKIVSLLIAEREGTHIYGDQIHAALHAQGLEFGARQIYHRLDKSAGDGGQPVFSVASLLKPGYLDPAQSKGFTTPGLTVFMVLPGPVPPITAFQDMLATTQALARQLNAEVYDGKRRPLSTTAARALQAEVEAYAHEYFHD